MRTVIFLTAAAGLALGACATNGAPREGYNAEYQRLAAECRAQNGILVPTGAPTTGNPATEYACERRTLQGRVD